MEVLFPLILAIVVLILFALAALRWGKDSRQSELQPGGYDTRFDWSSRW